MPWLPRGLRIVFDWGEAIRLSMMTDRRILFLQFADPAYFPPVMHAAGLIAGSGAHPVLLSFESFGMAPSDMPPEMHVSEVVIRSSGKGWRIKYDYFRYVLRAIFLCRELRPAFVYASDALACLPAVICRRLLGVPIVYHEHDAPPPPTGMSAAFIHFWRRRAAKEARINVLPSRGRVKEFAETVGVRPESVVVAMNCPSLSELSNPRPERSDDEFRIYYHGSLNWERLPKTVIEALAKLPLQVRLWVVGYETIDSKGFTLQLKHLAETLGVVDRIKIFGPLDRHQFLQVCVRADLGLSFMPRDSLDSNMRAMAGASNKAFDYLACGIPILVSPLADWRALFVDEKVAIECDPSSADAVAEAIMSAMASKDALDAMRVRGDALLRSRWNYERQFAPVLDVLAG